MRLKLFIFCVKISVGAEQHILTFDAKQNLTQNVNNGYNWTTMILEFTTELSHTFYNDVNPFLFQKLYEITQTLCNGIGLIMQDLCFEYLASMITKRIITTV